MSTYPVPHRFLPRARILIETGEGTDIMEDRGRVDNATVTVAGDVIIEEDFDIASCTRYEVKRNVPRPTVTLSADLASHDAKAIAEALLSSLQTIAGKAENVQINNTTDNSLAMLGYPPAGSVSNGVFTPDPFTSAEDSAGTPVPLVEGTHYEWYNPVSGVLKLLTVSGLTAPLKFNGSSRDSSRAVIANATEVKRRITFVGVNERDQCNGHTLSLWRCVLTPGMVALMSTVLTENEPQSLTLNMDSLEDPTRATDALLGRFGYFESAPI